MGLGDVGIGVLVLVSSSRRCPLRPTRHPRRVDAGQGGGGGVAVVRACMVVSGGGGRSNDGAGGWRYRRS